MREEMRKKVWCGLAAVAVMAGVMGNMAGCGQKAAATSNAAETMKTEAAGSAERTESMGDAKHSQSGEQTADYRTIVEEYASIFLPIDEDKYLYDCAIGTVGKYISGEENQENALKAVDDVVQELSDRKDKIENYTASTEMTKLMTAYGILPEEFEAFGNSRKANLTSDMIDLQALCEHLKNAEEFDFEHEEVVFWHDLNKAIQDSERGYYYYGCVNYWFSDWDEESVAYVQEHVVNQLKSCLPDTYAWETDKEVIEQKAMRYLDSVEEYLKLAVEHEGETKEDLYKMQQYHEKLLELIQKQQELDAMEKKLEQLKDISARIQVLSGQIEEAKNAGDDERLAELKVEFEAVVAEYEELTGKKVDR